MASSKLKAFCAEGHYQDNEKITHRMSDIFAKYLSDKGFIPRRSGKNTYALNYKL